MSRTDTDSDQLDLAEHDDLIERLNQRDDVDQRSQDTGRLDAMLEDLDTDLSEIPDDEILETSGLMSNVLDSDGETVGHVLMIEWDDVDDVMRVVRTAQQTPGVSVLLRSSPGSYHLYNLSVRDRDDQLLDAMRKNGDVWQARWAARRGYFVLRILPKIRSESREIYKPAPEPIHVFGSEREHPQSEAHAEMLLDICREQGHDEIGEQLRHALGEQDLMIGSGLNTEHYQTITDDAKDLLRSEDRA